MLVSGSVDVDFFSLGANLVAIFWHFSPHPLAERMEMGRSHYEYWWSFTLQLQVFLIFWVKVLLVELKHTSRILTRKGTRCDCRKLKIRTIRKFMWVRSHVSIWKDSNSNKIHSLKLTANAPENRPKPKRKGSSSNHHFSQTKVSGRVLIILCSYFFNEAKTLP